MSDSVTPLSARHAGASLVILAALAPAALAGDATVTVLLDGEIVASAVAEGVSLSEGPTELVGSAGNGSFNCSWDLVLDADASDGASVSGEVVFDNLEPQDRALQVVVDLPLCGAVRGASLVGGSVMLQLVAGSDGGLVTVPAGSAGFTAVAGDDEAASVFTAPWFVYASGAGIMSTSDDFGLPSPALPGPPDADAIAVDLDFRVSGDDSVRIDFDYVLAAGEGADVADCTMAGDEPNPDLDGSGQVDIFDLLVMLSAWGACPGGCPADLDLNGVVNFGDLTVLLVAWY